MSTPPTATEAQFQVVVNDEGQYSLWPVDRDPPAGWTAEGKTGPREECLAHVEEVWTDMTPKSLRTAATGNPS